MTLCVCVCVSDGVGPDRFPLPPHLPQKEDHFEITADVPGFKKEDVQVEVQNGVLVIKAENKEETKTDEEREGVKWHRVERRSGSLFRSVKLPPSADLEHINAKSEDGVLTVAVAKRPEAAPRRIAVA